MQHDMSWSSDKSKALYHIAAWSGDYVDINSDGHLCVQPIKDNHDVRIDLPDLVAQLQQEGLSLPILVRFSDILKDRVRGLVDAFATAIRSHNYTSGYTAVYPIKVNQQRRVIEDIIDAGNDNVGLESGSKPELLINIALGRPGSKLICNGYKDREYIRLALISLRLGFDTYIVIEKLSELPLIVECAEQMQITPRLGIRVRLSSIASGKWQNTGGEKSKFGLHANQVLTAIDMLQQHNMLASLRLLHFHIGSQVANLNDLKRGLIEGTRFYVQLRKMSIPIECMDIGGGLGIDYEGTQSDRVNSINYSVADYANQVIVNINSICQEENVDVPHVITESGRAMTAHHAMLITNIIDVEEPIGLDTNSHADTGNNTITKDYRNLLDSCEGKPLDDSYRQCGELYNKARQDFATGQLDLKQWACIDELHFAVLQQLYRQANSDDELINELREKLSAKYFANFSLFQSMPDTWAIDQIFPIVPLQRLLEKPGRRCTLQDLTCDSDGRVDYYVDGEGIETSLPIHVLQADETYLVGIFLLGAYQEILGDIHNLFGDSASANVDIDAHGNVELSELDYGDKVMDLFQTIHINPDAFRERYQGLIIASELDNDQKTEFLEQLVHGLEGYTYLEEE